MTTETTQEFHCRWCCEGRTESECERREFGQDEFELACPECGMLVDQK